ncbi:hypothetical protein LTR86_008096 [Recurvomyces mirabilis]|nr:hypothetical protein LTR86_008096 [Recurvomyces mirabilis]
MPPIPVHIDDPITPAKAQGVTPQTAAQVPVSQGPASNVATTTTAAAPATYPPGQPGAAVAPAPTPYLPRAQPEPTRTTAGGTQDQYAPPPPQPGAVPTPYNHQAPTTTSTLPPPPRAGETPKKQGTAFTGMLNSMYTPPPPAQNLSQNYGPTHSTSTAGIQPGQATTPLRTGPTTLNLGPVASPAVGMPQDPRISSEHPPGYVQNAYAQDMSSAQRASLDQETRRESFVTQLGLGSDGTRSGGDGGRGGGGEGWGEGVEGAWSAAKGWLGKAGTAIAEGEEQVWKRINGR